MKKVICISKGLNNSVNVEETYYIDLSSIYGDFDGDWFGEVYKDDKKEMYVGLMKLNHFKSAT